MPLSGMTGFAREEGAHGGWSGAVEARSVSRGMSMLEPERDAALLADAIPLCLSRLCLDGWRRLAARCNRDRDDDDDGNDEGGCGELELPSPCPGTSSSLPVLCASLGG